MRPGRAAELCAWLTVAVAIATCFPALGRAAGLPFEPNDSLTSAFGPLTAGQAYDASLESAADRDFYYFYATAPSAGTVTVAVHNLGGGSALSGVDATLLEATETPIAAIPYLGDGESRSVAARLTPQKYFVEVAPSEGSGDSYGLEVSGPIGPYGTISGHCVEAEQTVTAARKALNRAEAKLQRAIARLQRSRYAGPAARRNAQAAVRTARALKAKRLREVRDARTSREPWCSIGS
jgi:hypothetical protein